MTGVGGGCKIGTSTNEESFEMTILCEKIRTANKYHPCDACYWWDRSNYGQKDVSPDDWLIVEAAIADKFKITPGTKYLYKTFVYDGSVQNFKGRLDMDKICHKYDLYPEDE